MHIFSKSPFYMSADAQLLAVYSLCNSFGCSGISPYNTAPYIYIKTPPSTSVSLILGSLFNQTTIDLQWSAITGYYSSGGNLTVDYKVYIDSSIGYEVLLESTNSKSFILIKNFTLPLRQYIFFKVQPFNVVGPGYNSSISVIFREPDPPYYAPYSGSLTNTYQLHILWDPLSSSSQRGNPVLSYEIYMANASLGSEYFIILNATSPNFNMFNMIYSNNIISGQSYLVKYRAVNSFGPGLFSPIRTIYAAALPKAKEAVVVQQIGTNFHVSWNNSFEDNGYNITSYYISFRDYYGYYYQLSQCLGTNQTIIQSKNCTVQSSVLKSYLYLYPGDSMYVKAQATNQIGTSDYTPLQAQPVLLKSLPSQPYYSVYKGPSTNSSHLQILWDKLSKAESGYDNITAYEIRYQAMTINQSSATNLTSILNASAPSFSNYSLTIPIKNITKFAFQHRAWNSLGAGPYSATFYFTQNFEPPTINPSYYPSTYFNSTDRSKVIVDWDYVFKSEGLITQYAIYFISKNGDLFQLQPEYCDGTDPQVIRQKKCEVHTIRLLKEPLYLEIYDQVTVRIKAKNQAGWSSLTSKNSYGAIVRTAPLARIGFIKVGPKTDTKNIHLIWSGIDKYDENSNGKQNSFLMWSLLVGGDSNIDFIVYYGRGLISDTWEVLTSTTSYENEVFTQAHTDFQFIDSAQYKFKIQPFNSYGKGLNSTVIYATTEQEATRQTSSIPILMAGLLSALASFCA